MITPQDAARWRQHAEDHRDGKDTVHPGNISGVLIEVLDDLQVLRVSVQMLADRLECSAAARREPVHRRYCSHCSAADAVSALVS